MRLVFDTSHACIAAPLRHGPQVAGGTAACQRELNQIADVSNLAVQRPQMKCLHIWFFVFSGPKVNYEICQVLLIY